MKEKISLRGSSGDSALFFTEFTMLSDSFLTDGYHFRLADEIRTDKRKTIAVDEIDFKNKTKFETGNVYKVQGVSVASQKKGDPSGKTYGQSCDVTKYNIALSDIENAKNAVDVSCKISECSCTYAVAEPRYTCDVPLTRVW